MIKKNISPNFIKNIKKYIEINNIIKKSENNLLKINLKFVSILSEYKTTEDILYYIYINNFNTIYHPNQLFNLFNNDIEIYKQNNKYFILYQKKKYEIQQFIQKINNYSYETFKELTFRKEKEKLITTEENLIILFIGNLSIGKYILHKIINYKQLEKFHIAICCKYIFIKEIQQYIQNIHNYILYSSNEFGNDIVPSLLVWDDLKDRNYNNIIKIHTKSNSKILNNSLDFLLTRNIDELQLLKNKDCSCIGYTYIKIETDIFNKDLLNENKELIKNKYFVPYTIFLTEEKIMNQVLLFFKKNYKNIFLQNMYDTNLINKDYSYVHFMERLFGYI